MKKIKQVTSRIIVFINCILLCFVCFTPKKLYADAGVGTISQGKNVLLTILGYMGVELVGTAQVIDTYVQQAWQLFLNGLSSPWTPEAYTLTAIAGMVTWDDTNNVLQVPKDLYNLVSQWAQELTNSYNITQNTEAYQIGSYEFPADSGILLPSVTTSSVSTAITRSDGYRLSNSNINEQNAKYIIGRNNVEAHFAAYKQDDTHAKLVFAISNAEYSRLSSLGSLSSVYWLQYSSAAGTSSGFTIQPFSRYNDSYYVIDPSSISLTSLRTEVPLFDTYTLAVQFLTSGQGTIEDNIYVNGNVNLDDRVLSTDNGAQLELDPAVPAGQTFTLDEVLDAVLDWAISNTWPTDLTISDAIPIAIPEAIDTPLIPTAPYVEVPQILLPSNLPIIFSPECEDFSACLFNGITAVSSDITSFYNANEAIRNYANIILYIGVSFVALGVIRRHL